MHEAHGAHSSERAKTEVAPPLIAKVHRPVLFIELLGGTLLPYQPSQREGQVLENVFMGHIVIGGEHKGET